MKKKTAVLTIVSVILLLTIIAFFFRSLSDLPPQQVTTESFGVNLWNHWGSTIIIVAFIIFTGGMSILVLLGGGWRWE